MTRCPICSEHVENPFDMTVIARAKRRDGTIASFSAFGIHRRCVDDLTERWHQQADVSEWLELRVFPTPQATNATGPAP